MPSGSDFAGICCQFALQEAGAVGDGVFFPKGLGGRLYWLVVLPFRGAIFKGMANRIIAAAASMADDDPALP